MKILFISKADLPDYQNDMVFHGGRELFGNDFVDVNKLWYMYTPDKELYWNERIPFGGNSHGRGFTIAGMFEDTGVDRDDVESKIRNKYFDKIIYGSIHREQKYLDIVLEYYSSNDIIFVDGEDVDNQFISNLFEYGTYFKRELTHIPHQNVKPITFAIPKNKIIHELPNKTRILAHIIPGKRETYIYNNEQDYYKGYQESYFGVTHKKGGWDCLRHYEILANRCIPYFPDIESCPTNTMYNFPKKEIIAAKRMFESEEVDEEKYFQLENKLYKYTQNNLTTESLIKYILKINK